MVTEIGGKLKDFKGCVAAITGAGSGIGRALSIELASQGCHLALSDIRSDSLEKTKAKCARHSVQVQNYILDVSDQAAVFGHAEEVQNDFGKVNLIFNNAGVGLNCKLIDVDLKDFHWLMNINFWGVVYGTQAFLPKLIESGNGHVVNISSIFGLIAMPKHGAYNASKFAIRGYTEALIQELKMDGTPVKVSCVHPGFIATDIAKNAKIGGKEDASATQTSFNKVANTSAKSAAKTIIRGVRKNKTRILVGRDAFGTEILHRTLGSGYEKVTRLIARKLLY